MGKTMEAIFCVGYIITIIVLGTKIVLNGKEKKEYLWFGIMALVLVFGDSFHLLPRIISAIDRTGDYHVSLGIGKMITSITMTLFYLILYFVYSMRYQYNNGKMQCTMICLSALRVVLCLFPQNAWTGAAPVSWGIYRNIPFALMGLIMVVLFFQKRDDKAFRWMWLAITLSFLFYIPVVLWSDVSPVIGMLMMPKTCMYIWCVAMGYKLIVKAKKA